jgi:transposase
VIDAALLVLERTGLSAEDLTAAGSRPRREVPTFAAYVPVVAGAVSAGTRREYGSYWNKVVAAWGERRLDEPAPSEISLLMAEVKAQVVVRHNGRRGIRATIPQPADRVRNRLRRGSQGGRPPAFDPGAYKQRNVVERAFCHLRQYCLRMLTPRSPCCQSSRRTRHRCRGCASSCRPRGVTGWACVTVLNVPGRRLCQ